MPPKDLGRVQSQHSSFGKALRRPQTPQQHSSHCDPQPFVSMHVHSPFIGHSHHVQCVCSRQQRWYSKKGKPLILGYFSCKRARARLIFASSLPGAHLLPFASCGARFFDTRGRARSIRARSAGGVGGAGRSCVATMQRLVRLVRLVRWVVTRAATSVAIALTLKRCRSQ